MRNRLKNIKETTMRKVLFVLCSILLPCLVFAGDFYSGMKDVDKDTCRKVAAKGYEKGKRDWRYGIKDCNKWDIFSSPPKRNWECTLGSIIMSGMHGKAIDGSISVVLS